MSGQSTTENFPNVSWVTRTCYAAMIVAGNAWCAWSADLPDDAAQRVPISSLESSDLKADPASGVRISELKRHASFLASDSLEGRQAGTRGGQASAAYLISEMKRYQLQPAGVEGDYRQSFGAGYANVLAMLPGRGELVDEAILIGAHYDHVGYGNPNNSNGPWGQIHNGADDNASGTSVLLELCRLLSANGPHRRTILFAAWDAEEAGLLGSQHWVNHSTLDRGRIKLALNLDMVGRLQSDVHVMGWRTANGLRTQLSLSNPQQSIRFQFDPVVSADSDHHSFYAARIPVLHFDTGKHNDYHRPSDDVPLLNWEGMVRLGDVLALLVQKVADAESLPGFRLESWNERPLAWPSSGKTPPPPRLGVTWNQQVLGEGILEVAQVVDGYPAAEAGLQPGDRLLEFAGWNGGSLDELRAVITAAPGDIELAWSRIDDRINDSMLQRKRLSLRGAPVIHGLTCRLDSALPGCAIVQQVVETSAADRAGIWPGDVLIEVGSQPVKSLEQLENRLTQAPRPLPIRAERRGQPFQVQLKSLPSHVSADRGVPVAP